MVLSGDLKICRARNTNIFLILRLPDDPTPRSCAVKSVQVTCHLVNRRFIFFQRVLFSFMYNNTNRKYGPCYQEFYCKNLFVSDNEMLLVGKSFGLPWVIFLFELFVRLTYASRSLAGYQWK